MKNQQQKKQELFWFQLWRILKPSRPLIKFTLFTILITEVVNLIGPYFLKIVIDKISNFNSAETLSIIFFIFLMFVSNEVTSLVSYWRDRKVFRLILDIEYYLPIEAQEKLVNLSLHYHEKENTGNKITKIEKGVGKISELIGNLSWEVIPTIMQLILTVTILLFFDWRLALALLLFAPIIIWITVRANMRLLPIRKKRFLDYEIASGIMGQSIININTVKSFVQEKREVEKYKTIRKDIRKNELKEWFDLMQLRLGRNLLVDIGRAAILLLGVYLIIRNEITIGTLVFVITLTEKSYSSLHRLSRFYDKAEEGAVGVRRFIGLIDQENDITNPEKGYIAPNIVGNLQFRNVSFQYENARENALKNINLNIAAGTSNALVGPSGGGKTTLARMMYRHYDPQKGQVLLDGVDLRKHDLYHFRKFFAIVPQEVEIFDTTIAENISYGNPHASLKEIIKAAKIANAEEFIEKLPQKYKTEVGERGIKLSGGQRQRLGIARAILNNPRVLIFDEATSNLDSYSEKLIQDAMSKISQGRTVITIAHRLSTIKKADNIIVLEKGRVVEQGNHEQLCQNSGGLYSKLLSLQQLGDID